MSRKRFCAIAMLVVCDDKGRILCHHIGWPGSVHDNRVWRNCRLFLQCERFFSKKECLLGDSAFTASEIMIPPFKAASGAMLTASRTAFNACLAKPRVKSEHCIGALKGRWPFLREIRHVISGAKSVNTTTNYARGTVTLHNCLMEDPVDDDWPQNEPAGDHDTEEPPSANSNEPNYERRDELHHYLSEIPDTAAN